LVHVVGLAPLDKLFHLNRRAPPKDKQVRSISRESVLLLSHTADEFQIPDSRSRSRFQISIPDEEFTGDESNSRISISNSFHAKK